MTGEVCVYLGPLQNTFKAKYMLAFLQRRHCLLSKGAEADIAFICSTGSVYHGGIIHFYNIAGQKSFGGGILNGFCDELELNP